METPEWVEQEARRIFLELISEEDDSCAWCGLLPCQCDAAYDSEIEQFLLPEEDEWE